MDLTIALDNLISILNGLDAGLNFDIVGILGSGSLGGGAPVTPDAVPTP